ncbi:hypothetical protein LJC01_01610 [Clostridiaceae bacterium OttesenSCG-928-D20]|nr:hypothetical protein [Clostridiaceae bacterium OttesenSCG-928-D20]
MKTRKSLGVGSVSLILIFCLLCLTIFALLTLSSARVENTMAEKYADSIKRFYSADTIAAEVYSALSKQLPKGERPGEIDGIEIMYEEGEKGVNFTFSSPLDARRAIAVSGSYTEDGIKLKSWNEEGDSVLDMWVELEPDDWEPFEELPIIKD